MSETTSSGGFSKSSRYVKSCWYAALRSLCLPLYSQPKKPRIQTSAKPSPPDVFVTPFSKVYVWPVWSASEGRGYPRTSQRSLKWDCAPARSFSSDFCHLDTKSDKIIFRTQQTWRDAYCLLNRLPRLYIYLAMDAIIIRNQSEYERRGHCHTSVRKQNQIYPSRIPSINACNFLDFDGCRSFRSTLAVDLAATFAGQRERLAN